MKKKGFSFISCFFLFFIFSAGMTGCVSSDVTIRKVSPESRPEYSSGVLQTGHQLMPESVNVLGNFLLNDLMEKEPVRVLEKLEKLYQKEPLSIYVETLADCSLFLGLRFRSDANMAARYYLSAVLYSYSYLFRLDQVQAVYNPSRLRMMRIYNLALTELFAYLCEKKLERNGGFELTAAAGQTVFFTSPESRLKIDRKRVKNLFLCADYRPVNLTHVSHRLGIGAPVIVSLSRTQKDDVEIFAADMVLSGTLVLEFESFPKNSFSNARYICKLVLADSRNENTISMGGKTLPLEQDLTTPLAYMAKDPPPFHFLFYMMRPDETVKMQGLYCFETFDPNRIPIVLVHGLMSDTRTWLQMINTLRSDPEILKNYQIYGFSYSSGNPIANSAFFLRQALVRERQRIIKAGHSTEKFDQMVLVGHSMGGLLSRFAISYSGDIFEKLLTENGKVKLEEQLSELEPALKKKVLEAIHFEPLPFIKRVVFIAVPHRGSSLATSWIGRFGAWTIRLPQNVIKMRETNVFKKFLGAIGRKKLKYTGIDNLDPENVALKYLNKLKLSETVPYHSIIGNLNEAGSPGGSDGIVSYASSHLDSAQSELVVKSGHSAQKNPLAIQELRRILLLHLKEIKDAGKK